MPKIRQIYEEYDLENTAYLSFSGGKDSTLLSALLDFACPGNKIPRVFATQGWNIKNLSSLYAKKQKQIKDLSKFTQLAISNKCLKKRGIHSKARNMHIS